MPTAPRPAQSLLALALIVNLLAASAPAPAYGMQRPSVTALAANPAALPRPADDHAPDPTDPGNAVRRTSAPAPNPIRADWISRPKPAVPEARATAVSKQQPSGSGSAKGTAFKGRNHVWIPALGVDRSVTSYACSSSYHPGNRVYRWGCAGSNNVYLFGHAHSVFKALHDAYVRGRLKKGMKVYYANGDGNVATYAVSWWKVTTPDKGSWAYAGQSRPSLTLQTCVGAKSQYRLIVRFAKVG